MLPFVNISGDPEQDYFVDGLTEDLITALTAWRIFPVISRNSVFAYKGQSPDVRRVARELSARYVLEGSVRKGGNRVRISAQLIDASTGHHVWAEKFDRDLEDVFSLQDEITQRIVATVKPELRSEEQKRSLTRSPSDLTAWEYCQRGWSLMNSRTKEGNEQAREMFARCLELDAFYPQAHAGLATSHLKDAIDRHTDSFQSSVAKSLDAAQKALALDDSSSSVHTVLANALRESRRYDEAIYHYERAIALDPSNTYANSLLGHTLGLLGRPDEAIAKIEEAIQINPSDPYNYQRLCDLGRAHLSARRYEEAIESVQQSLLRRPDQARAHMFLAIALGHLGRTNEARDALAECERLHPGFAGKYDPGFENPPDTEHFLEGLRRAGLEG